MSEVAFSADELGAVSTRLEGSTPRLSWCRTIGARGQDVIEIEAPGVDRVRVAKAEHGHFRVIGLKGWSLAIFARLEDLLDMIDPPRVIRQFGNENVFTAA